MNYLLLLIGSILLFAWYIRDRVSGKKITAAPPGDYWGTVLKHANGEQLKDLSVDDNIDSTTNPIPTIRPGRLYYGIPGRSFKGYIWNGRVITGGN